MSQSVATMPSEAESVELPVREALPDNPEQLEDEGPLLLNERQTFLVVASALGGVPYDDIAQAFKVNPETIEQLRLQALRQGLIYWCLHPQERVVAPSTAPKPISKRGRPRRPPQVNCALVPEVVLAAVTVVNDRQLGVNEAADLFNLAPTFLTAECLKLKTMGFEAWSAQVRAISAEPKEILQYRRPRQKIPGRKAPNPPGRALLSHQRRLAIFGTYMGKIMSMTQLAEANERTIQNIAHIIAQAKEDGLIAWCLQERTLAQGAKLSPAVVKFEQEHPLTEPNLATIPELMRAAVVAVTLQHMELEQVAFALGCDPSLVESWIQAANEQGIHPWFLSLPPCKPRFSHKPTNTKPRHSGYFRIKLVGASLSGRWTNWNLHELFGVSPNTMPRYVNQTQEQGLFTWCQALREFDQTPLGQAYLEVESKLNLPEVDLSTVAEFQAAAREALKAKVPADEVAAVLGLDPQVVARWARASKRKASEPEVEVARADQPVGAQLGDEQALDELTPREISMMLRRHAHINYSGNRRIEMLGAFLLGSTQVNLQLAKRLRAKAQEMGLYAWCRELRRVDQLSPRAQALLLSEKEELPLKVNLAQVPAFQLAAVHAIEVLGLDPKEVVTTFKLTLKQVKTWCTAAEQVGFAQWAQRFTPSQRMLVGLE